MENKKPKDYQTLSLFLILGGLTLVFVLGLRLVLFAPNQSPRTLDQQAIEAVKAP